jgi:hypothetical protein
MAPGVNGQRRTRRKTEIPDFKNGATEPTKATETVARRTAGDVDLIAGRTRVAFDPRSPNSIPDFSVYSVDFVAPF